MPNNLLTPRTIINKVLAHAKKQLPEDQFVAISHFIKLFFAHTCLEDLEERSISDLYGIALSQWMLIQERQPNELKLRVFNPQYEECNWQSTHTVVQIVSDDMPFIIDSVRMEINRLNMTMHLMVNTSGLSVKRDKQGQLQGITAYSHHRSGATNGHFEAPIYMEIDRQTDSAVLDSIKENIERVLTDVRMAVEDWPKMQERMRTVLKEMSKGSMPQKAAEVKESVAFLEWVLENHFTYLGVRDYEVVGSGNKQALRLIEGSGLGVLRDDSQSKPYRHFVDMPDQARELMLSKDQILVISKTNTLSTVHRSSTYTDYIGVKRFKDGKLIGERRFIGLYTSTAYNSSPQAIPFLRNKVAAVLKKSGLPLNSHAGKDLIHILETLPRDDLFQATPVELFNLSMDILHLQERRRICLFAREDAYGRFISCLVYIPRENFNTNLLNKISNILRDSFNGVEVNFSTHFSESILARVHYVVRIESKRRPNYEIKEIEQKLIEIGKSWEDGFKESVLDYFGEERGNLLIGHYCDAFPAGYREVFAPRNAVYDIDHIEMLSSGNTLGMSFYRPLGAAKNIIRFKLFRADYTVPLSDALPLLEHMGLRVEGEQPYCLTFKDGKKVWINDFSMTYAKETHFDVEEIKPIFQEAFNKIWFGYAESDNMNRLVLEAQLGWREITILRAYAKYLRQTGFTFTPQYIAETLVQNPKISRLLVELFYCYFDPEKAATSKEQAKDLEAQIKEQLDEVAILDEDRILRRLLDVIHATLRTNYFQLDAKKQFKSYLSFKLDPSRIPELPLPLPKYEIFVHSPRFEGVHLRAGKVARGGIRWSDRREDFRMEVLGLMKAQQVKNAVIVPAGAKGGFVPKSLPINGTREEILEEGIACYRDFIEGLLDLTDNLISDTIIPPQNTVCYDEPDHYLVVAADKGTATFSDIANSIALERNYWLGDAFASGGSTGYDHKKMGITAKGAWVSAERHFQELGTNVNEAPITVMGIGDMAGDVFGNGLLSSRHIKLIFAFNHQHIFIDPNPDAETSYLERKRLFSLPRSSWDDYKREIISVGGGVFRRIVKSIKITPEIKEALGIQKDYMVPNELIQAALKAPVDLIWNGGIGTFVKASTESNLDVVDRANDALRINGNELRAKVVCEGGNLGLTQLARVEYELNGGKINTDFIDNSAGVDCSDHEVNIKILLNSVVEAADLTEKQRNALLVRMTNEVASLVLQNNYHQNQSISLAAFLSSSYLGLYMRYIDDLTKEGLLDRDLEFIPNDETLLERKAAGLGLTRPEISVLFAYSKIVLEDEIRKSELTNDLYLSQFIKNAFPTPLRRRYGDLLEKHCLRDEIISTQLSNRLVSDMGITFIYQMKNETGATTSEIVRAYTAAQEIFHMPNLYADIESLDYKVDTVVQNRMIEQLVRLIRRTSRWLLRNRREHLDIQETISRYADHVDSLFKRLPRLLLGADRVALEERRDALMSANVPEEIATKIASTIPMYHALNIIEAATSHNTQVNEVAKIYFMLVDRLDLIWFRDQINSYQADSRWSVLARAAYKGDLDWIQRELTMGVLHINKGPKSASAKLNAWFSQHQLLVERWHTILGEIRGAVTKDFAILSVAIRELSDLARESDCDTQKQVCNQKREEG